MAAALRHDGAVVIVAWIAEQNLPSRRVAERIGLVHRGPGVDPSDGRTRLAYTDRPFSA
jgi:RimJ/RimL family protein N-acetyltransferase